MDHYRKRSNVETAFAMTKAKFGGTVRFKNPAAQVNEVLVKIRCHYICVLVQAMYALCVEPTFASKPVRPFLGARFPFRLPPSLVDAVSIGTGFTAGLGRYGRCSARYAEASFDGFPPFLSGMEAAVLPALRGRGLLPLGLQLLPAFGFKECRSRRGAGLRLLGLFCSAGRGLPPALLGFGNVMVNVKVRPTAQSCGLWMRGCYQVFTLAVIAAVLRGCPCFELGPSFWPPSSSDFRCAGWHNGHIWFGLGVAGSGIPGIWLARPPGCSLLGPWPAPFPWLP